MRAETLRDQLTRGLTPVIGASLLVMLLLAFTQVVLRYAFAASLLWVEEVSVMLLSWMAWLGAIQLWLDRGHLVVDLLPAGRAAGLRHAIAIGVNALAVVGGIALAIVSTETLTAFGGIEMGSLEIDASVKYYPVVAGGIGLAAAGGIELWRLLSRSGKGAS